MGLSYIWGVILQVHESCLQSMGVALFYNGMLNDLQQS